MVLGSYQFVFLSIANCEANQGFQPSASGGDGTYTQFCEQWLAFGKDNKNRDPHLGYVGFDPDHDTVIVAHQGTNPASL